MKIDDTVRMMEAMKMQIIGFFIFDMLIISSYYAFIFSINEVSVFVMRVKDDQNSDTAMTGNQF